jgi:hypothetical protein
LPGQARLIRLLVLTQFDFDEIGAKGRLRITFDSFNYNLDFDEIGAEAYVVISARTKIKISERQTCRSLG